MSQPTVSRRIAEYLLDIGAVQFSPDPPFTWTSGLKAPIYCDNRLTISYPEIRSAIRDAFQQIIVEKQLDPQLIVGTATAGIPHAAWLADELEFPMVYVRSAPKGHGMESQIEGRAEEGARAVVIEDLISTGRSSAGVVDVLRRENVRVEAVLAIFSYELDQAQITFQRLGIPLFTLTSFDELFATASARNELSDIAIKSIRAWRDDPEAWSDRHD